MPPGQARCPSRAKPAGGAGPCRSSGAAAVPAASPNDGFAYSLSLSASANAVSPGTFVYLTASANIDVGPTPYYIEIYDTYTGNLLVACGSGYSCAASVYSGVPSGDNYQAFIGYYSGYPPNYVVASNAVAVTWFSVSLTTSPAALVPGRISTVTAAANGDVGPTPYYIEIYDQSSGALVALCGAGYSCSTAVYSGEANYHQYVATVADYATTYYPGYSPPGMIAQSGSTSVTWFSVFLQVTTPSPALGASTTLTAVANGDVGPTPYYLAIYDYTAKADVAICGTGSSCSTTVSSSTPYATRYLATVAGYSTSYSPPSAIAISGATQVAWGPFPGDPPPLLPLADQPSNGGVISGDASHVAYSSAADNLVPGDTNARRDIFELDRTLATTYRVSADSSANQADGDSFDPAISADGRYVAFESNADNLVAGDTNGLGDVFEHDLSTGATTMVSVASGGGPAYAESFQPAVSGDGSAVVFTSAADDLVGGVGNGYTKQVYLRYPGSGITILVSASSSGAPADADSFSPSISADGNYVAYESAANNLVPGISPVSDQVYVRNLFNGTTSIVSLSPDGTPANGDPGADRAFHPSISADGSRVAFSSDATNLVPGSYAGTPQVYVRDTSINANGWVSSVVPRF